MWRTLWEGDGALEDPTTEEGIQELDENVSNTGVI